MAGLLDFYHHWQKQKFIKRKTQNHIVVHVMFRPTKGSEIETKFRGTCAVVYFGRHSLTLQCMVSQAQNHLFGQIGPSGVRRNMHINTVNIFSHSPCAYFSPRRTLHLHTPLPTENTIN